MIDAIITGRKYYTEDYCTAISFARFYDGDVVYAPAGYFVIIPK
jgi:hypothetical protein